MQCRAPVDGREGGGGGRAACGRPSRRGAPQGRKFLFEAHTQGLRREIFNGGFNQS